MALRGLAGNLAMKPPRKSGADAIFWCLKAPKTRLPRYTKKSAVAPLAQLDRAFGYEPKGREFESLRAHHLLLLSFFDLHPPPRQNGARCSLFPFRGYPKSAWSAQKAACCDLESHPHPTFLSSRNPASSSRSTGLRTPVASPRMPGCLCHC